MSADTSMKSFGRALSTEEKKELSPIDFDFYGTVFKAKPMISGKVILDSRQRLAKAENNNTLAILSEIVLDYLSNAFVDKKESARFMKFVADTEEVAEDDLYALYQYLVSEQSNRPTDK